MSRTDSTRRRLEISLVKLSRASAARANASSRAQDQARPSPDMAQPYFAPRALEPDPIPQVQPEPAPVPAQEPGPTAAELAAELIERLDRIEERLSDLTRPVRPIPASREIFAEWVRLRKWEEMAFGDFLRLRRSGVV